MMVAVVGVIALGCVGGTMIAVIGNDWNDGCGCWGVAPGRGGTMIAVIGNDWNDGCLGWTSLVCGLGS